MTREELEAEVLAIRDLLGRVRQEVARVYVGPSRVVDTMLTALLAHGHVLLEGVPGVAKTTLVKSFAATLGASVRRIQFTADLVPSDITGTYVLSPRDGTFALRPGPVFANVILADEINRAPAKTQAALLEAMQERQVTIEGDRYALPHPFMVLATQNPIDLEGTYPLPEAQIDRFLLHIPMGYPSPREESFMLRTHNLAAPEARPILTQAEVLHGQAVASRVHLEEDLFDYAVALSSFTRAHPKVSLGASPRASLALVQAAKSWAVLEGRAYATPDDFRQVAVSVLAHRLILAPEAEGSDRAAIVQEALVRVGYRRSIAPV